MTREADNNRVARSMEHAMAAITNLRSIKDANTTPDERKEISESCETLAGVYRRLRRLVEGGDE